MRRLASWQASVPRVVSSDPALSRRPSTRRWPTSPRCGSSTPAHPERPVIAAGAPWFMTLFGRDSLLTSWMTLPFDPTLAAGVLVTLAELQGRRYDPIAEEQPGQDPPRAAPPRRRWAVRRPRSATTAPSTPPPLFVMLAAEAQRWGALTHCDLLDALRAGGRRRASTGCSATATPNGDGFVDYQRSDPAGLSNQGWKDSWDGVNFADGIAARRADRPRRGAGLRLRGAARRGRARPRRSRCRTTPTSSRAAPRALRQRFNATFWDERGWFVIGLDGRRPADRLADDQPGSRPVDRHRRPRARRPLPRPPRRTGDVDRLGAPDPRRARWPPTTRSATTTGRCGRTTPRSAPPAPPATAGGTSSTRSSTARSTPPASSTAARPSCSPASLAAKRRCPSPTRRRARRRPGRRRRSCCCCAPCSIWRPRTIARR